MAEKKYLVRMKDAILGRKEDGLVPVASSGIQQGDLHSIARETKDLKARLDEISQKVSFSAGAQGLSVAFCFDTTSSMGEYREIVRGNLNKIVSELLSDKQTPFSLMVCGVGEYNDEYNGTSYTLQMNEFTRKPEELKKQIIGIRDTDGGGKCQVSLELLFQKLNTDYITEGKNHLCVIISDQIAHGQDGSWGTKVDYLTELRRLKEHLRGFYFVGCSTNESIMGKQRQLINQESADERFIEFKDMMILPELLIAITKRTLSREAQREYVAKLCAGDQDQQLAGAKIRAYLPDSGERKTKSEGPDNLVNSIGQYLIAKYEKLSRSDQFRSGKSGFENEHQYRAIRDAMEDLNRKDATELKLTDKRGAKYTIELTRQELDAIKKHEMSDFSHGQ